MYNATTNTWEEKKPFPGVPRVGPFAFVLDGYGYMGAGDTTNASTSIAHDFWKYDPQHDTWTQLRDFPYDTYPGAVGFQLGNKGYVFEAAGMNPTAPLGSDHYKKLWSYDAQKDTWSAKATIPASGFGGTTLFTLNGKAYVTLGFVGETPAEKKDFWVYDPVQDQWQQKGDAGGGSRMFSFSFAINGKGYVGFASPVFEEYFYDWWQYTP